MYDTTSATGLPSARPGAQIRFQEMVGEDEGNTEAQSLGLLSYVEVVPVYKLLSQNIRHLVEITVQNGLQWKL